MIVQCSVDWISITFPRSDMMPDDALLGRWKFTGKGMHGYSARWQDSISNAVFQSFGPESMGSHLTCTGEVMHNLRIAQTDQQTVKSFLDKDGKPSRIDVAMDVFGSQITPVGMAEDYKAGLLRTRARTATLVNEVAPGGKPRGQTLYVGNRQSDRFMRAYDKGFEQGIVDGEAWLRLELELKNIQARGAGGAIVEHGVEQTTKGHLSDMITYNNPEYITALSGPAIAPTPTERKHTNTEKWLLDTVSLTIAKCINKRPEFWNELLDSIAKHCTMVRNELDN